MIGVKDSVGSPWSPARTLVGHAELPRDRRHGLRRERHARLPEPARRQAGAVERGLADDASAARRARADAARARDGAFGAFPATRASISRGRTRHDFDNVQVVRKAGSPPADPTDGTVVYTGTGTSFSDIGVTNGTTYYYAVWSVRRGEIATAPATASTTPSLPAGRRLVHDDAGRLVPPTRLQLLAGTVFHVTQDQLLLQLGRVYQPADPASNQIGIWDATTQALVYSGTVSAAAPTLVLTSPVLLTAGRAVRARRPGGVGHAVEPGAEADGPAGVPRDRRQRVRHEHDLQRIRTGGTTSPASRTRTGR